MRLQILHVPDCPNLALLAARMEAVLAGRTDVEVDRLVVTDQDEAARFGMAGSPTLLVEGTDPFAEPGQVPSVSCRLYVDEAGAVMGAPSEAQLRAVLAGHRPTVVPRRELSLVGWRAAGTGSRQAALLPALRELHQGVLRYFLIAGEAPHLGWLSEQASGLGLDLGAALGRLADADLVHLDDSGRVVVAYPFSAGQSRHRVRLAGGPSVWAMCAIDALGIPPMAERDATITATDPATGESITVEAHDGHWRWTPVSAVVLVAQSGAGGPSAECTCGHVDFYARPEHAQAYLDAHPNVTGRVLDQPSAVALAEGVFGGLLREG